MKEIEQVLADAASRSYARQAQTAARRVSEAASVRGLVEVAYASVDSPFGAMVAAVTRRGLIRLSYNDYHLDKILEELATRISPRVLEVPGRLDQVRRQLDEYFRGRRREFDIRIDWSLTTGFTRRVLEATFKIAYGRTLTYAGIAAAAGNPRASRAAGNALGDNPIPIVVPCHRVLRSGGGIGGYTGGVERKRFLLGLEGLPTAAQ